ncbi:MAG: hypothetical protein M3R00_02790 [Pseudomonadota bacterium]|nr:hypothetical protein [Pseudomonadota bacterium]
MQFKIILRAQVEAKIVSANLKSHEAILRCDVSGSDMTQAADRVGQVPAALLNESALAGSQAFSTTNLLHRICQINGFRAVSHNFLQRKQSEGSRIKWICS